MSRFLFLITVNAPRIIAEMRQIRIIHYSGGLIIARGEQVRVKQTNIKFFEGAKMRRIFLRGKKINFMNKAVSSVLEPCFFKTSTCGRSRFA